MIANSSKSVVLIIDLKPRLRRGFEYLLIGLAQGLRAMGRPFEVIIPVPASEWFVKEFDNAGGILHVIPGNRPGMDLAANINLLRKIRPEILLICFYPMFHPKVLALTRLPWVKKSIYVDQASYHVKELSGWRSGARNLRGKLVSRCYERIITVSQFSKGQLVKYFCADSKRIDIIHNAVRPNFYDGLNQPNVELNGASNLKYIFYAGSLTRDKGVHTLVDACANLWREQQFLDVQLWLAGAGPLEAYIQNTIEKEHLDTRIRLLGLRDDIPALVKDAAVNVVPSEWPEACAFAALEALAAGRPVVFSDAGSLPELLGDGGTIFPKQDSCALAEALAQNLTPAGDHWTKAQTNAKRAREEFSFDKMLGAYLGVIERAMKCSIPL